MEARDLRARRNGGSGVRVIPPDDDEFVTVRALDLVGKTMACTDVLGATATAHLDGGFVVIQYDGMPSYRRTLIRSDAHVRVKRHG
jgi:hypothetical protein